MNINELVLEKINNISLRDIANHSLAVRLTNVKDGSLTTTAENTAVTDAVGATIMTLWNAVAANLSGTNALFSTDLYAAQSGSEKEVASSSTKITTSTYEVLEATANKLVLAKTPVKDSIKEICLLQNGGIAKKLTLASGTADANTFTIADKTITLAADTTGTFYVEYDYESEKAVKVTKSADKFPGVYEARIYVTMRDACNKNDIYTGVIIAKRAEIDPSSIEIGLNAEGGHPFQLNFNKEYCDPKGDLFSIIVDE